MIQSGKESPHVKPMGTTAVRRAFTLVELLIVIAIIGLLVAILTPAIHLARQRARNLQCQNNLKQLAIGMVAHSSDSRGSYCTGAWNWKEDGAVTENGWVADLVNLEIPVGELLCPTNPAQMTETYHQLLTLDAGSFNVTCEAGLGSAPTTLPDGTPYSNPCRAIQPMAVAPGSTDRVPTIAEKIYEKSFNTNYTPTWFLCRSGLRLDGNLNLNPRSSACGIDIRSKNCCVGPLRDRSLGNVVASTVPILGDGGISLLQLPVAIGRVPQGDFLTYGMTGGPKLKVTGQDVITASGYASGASNSASRWTELAKNSVQDYSQFGVHHGGQFNVAMADGSVKAFSDDNEDGAINTGFQAVGPFEDSTVEAAMTVDQKIEHLYSLDDKSARL